MLFSPLGSRSFRTLEVTLAMPLWGGLADRYGPKRVVLLTQAGLGISCLALGLSGTCAAMLGARAACSCFAVTTSLLKAYVVKVP